MNACERVIIALDTTDVGHALSIAESLVDHACWIKVGMTLFDTSGPDIVERLRAMGYEVFIDLKLHDIPHQVEGAAEALARLGCSMFTVHAQGGRTMIEAAIRGAQAGAEAAGHEVPLVIAVTVLTSLSADDLTSAGIEATPAEYAAKLARLAWDAGVDGVVCSPEEAATMRATLGPEAVIVTPGVRPHGSSADDQSRIATPAAALAAGASFLVVGRPITAAADPRRVFDALSDELEEIDE
jgi:orotidine-5'-phosphate decarboxylase